MCNAGVARAVWRAHELARMAGREAANGRTSFSSIMELDVVLGDLLMHPDPIMHDAVCTSKRSAVAREERRIGNLPPRTVARRSALGQGAESVAANPRHAPTPPTGDAAGWGWVRREGAHAGAAEEPVMRVTCPSPAHRLFGSCARDAERESVVVLRRDGKP